MATPTFTLLNHTSLTTADSNTGWNDLTTADPDIKVEGSNAMSGVFRANGEQGYYDSGGAPVTAVGKTYRGWIFTNNIAYMGTDGSGDEYKFFAYDGSTEELKVLFASDTYPGGWFNIIWDMDDFTTLTLASVDRWGVESGHATNAKNLVNTWMDVMRYLDGYSMVGGTTGDRVRLSDISTLDKTSAYGVCTAYQGVYFATGKVQFGTGATAHWFEMDGQVFVFTEQNVATGLYELSGVGSGTNITIVSSVLRSTGASDNTRFIIDFSDTNLATCVFTDNLVVRASTIDFSSTVDARRNIFDDCGQITPGGADIRDCTVLNYEGTSDTGAVVYNETADPSGEFDGMSFTKGTASTHAIEFGLSSPTTISLTDLSFSGYNASNGQTDSTLYFARTSGTVTVNLSGVSGTVTYKSAGATISLVNSTTLTLTGLKNPTEVRVYDAGTTTEVAGQENVTTGTFATGIDAATYPDVDISVVCLGYQNLRLLGIDVTSDRTIPVSQVIDRQYENPAGAPDTLYVFGNSFEGIADSAIITAANSGGGSGDAFSVDPAGVCTVLTSADLTLAYDRGFKPTVEASTELVLDDFEGQGTSPTDDVTSITTSNTLADSLTGTASAAVFSSSAVMDGGTFGLTYTMSSNFLYSDYQVTANGVVWVHFKLKFAANPAAYVLLAEARASGGRNCELQLLSTGALRVRDGSQTATSAATSALSTDTEHRVAWGIDATNGDTFIRTYTGDSMVPTNDVSDTTVSMNNTTTDTILFGCLAQSTFTMRLDSFRVHADAEYVASQQASYVPWTIPTASPFNYFRLYVRLASLPPATCRVLRLYSGATIRAELRIGTSGEVLLTRQDGSWLQDLDSNLSTSTIYRIEGYVNSSTQASDLRVFAGDLASELDTITDWEAYNSGTVDAVVYGAMFTSSQSYSGLEIAAVAYSQDGWIGAANSTLRDYWFDAEGGTAGQNATTSDAYGVAFDAITSSVFEYKATGADGTSTYLETPNNTTAIAQWDHGSQVTQASSGFWFRCHTASPAADVRIADFRNNSSSGTAGGVIYSIARRIRIMDASTGIVTGQSAALAVDTWYWITMRFDFDAGTVGVGQVVVYAADGTLFSDTGEYTLTINTQTDVSTARWGQIFTVAAGLFDFDQMCYQPDEYALIAPWVEV